MKHPGELLPFLVLGAALLVAGWRRRYRKRPATPRQTSVSIEKLLGVTSVTGVVAVREIRQRLRGRAFRGATALLLIGVAAAIVIPVAVKGKPHAQQVGVVGAPTASLRGAATAAAASVKADVHLVTEADTTAAEAALRSGRIDVAVIDGNRLLVKRAPSSGDTTQTATFTRALAQILGVDKAVRAAGLTADQVARIAGAEPVPTASLEPARTSTAGRATAVIGLVVLMIMLSQYLSWTLIGVMEEKSSRVVEVLLAAVRPLQLLTGKVIGIGAVVFAQAGIVAAFALVLARVVGSDLLRGTSPLVVISTLLWLLLGYAFYCWLYAAAGSMVERQDQVQSLAIPLALPILAGYIVSVAVVGSGDSAATWFQVLAYLPPTAPFAMTALVGLGSASWWQFTLSALLTAASTVAVARLAAAVYRRAILRTGRRVRLRELASEHGRALPS